MDMLAANIVTRRSESPAVPKGGRRGRGAKDLSGQRFGRLTALERLEEKSGSCYLWRCVCDCGNEVKVRSSALLSGNTTSCGCARRDACAEKAKDIAGQRFGKLTAREPLAERRNGSVLWLCDCDCGEQARYTYNELTYCGVKSCACAQHQSKALPLHYIDGTCVEQVVRRRLRRDNTSGCTGVAHTKRGWRAQISFKGKTYYLGIFNELSDAVKARKEAENELFASFLDWYEATRPGKEKDRNRDGKQQPGLVSGQSELRP